MSNAPTCIDERNAWVEVDTAALTANAALLKAQIAAGSPSPDVIAVVKADGYGHGAVRAAKAFQAAGITRFAVTSLDEALDLIDGGIDVETSPVLLFAPVVTRAQALSLAAKSLVATVCDAHHVRLLIAAAEETGAVVPVHLKVDTGMGRLGFRPDEAEAVARLVARSDKLRLAGVYTHFPNAGARDLSGTIASLRIFTVFCDRLKAIGIDPGVRHAANSAAALRFPESRLDAVRLGTVLYGQYPSAHVPRVQGLSSKTWQAKARVVFVHDLPRGARVGYGSEATLTRNTRVAVIAVGFADGFAVSPNSVFAGLRGVQALIGQLAGKGNPAVWLHGKQCPVVGRVAMQMIVVDVSALSHNVVEGDIADVPMRRLTASARLPRIDVPPS